MLPFQSSIFSHSDYTRFSILRLLRKKKKREKPTVFSMLSHNFMNLWNVWTNYHTTYISWSNQWHDSVYCLECECLHVNIKVPNENFQCLVWIKISLIKIIYTAPNSFWRRNWNCPFKCIQYALFISNIHKFMCVVN